MGMTERKELGLPDKKKRVEKNGSASENMRKDGIEILAWECE